jgi:hypothetical protein
MGLPIIYAPHVDFLRLVLLWLQETKGDERWLLVLDNVDNLDILSSGYTGGSNITAPLSEYAATTRHVSILITTCDKRVASQLVKSPDQIMYVENLPVEDSTAIVSKKLPNETAAAKVREDLVIALDCLPLAITQAAAAIKTRSPLLTIQKYLDLLTGSERHRAALLGKEVKDVRRNIGEPCSILKALQVSFLRLEDRCPKAINMLLLISILDGRGVPDVLINHFVDDKAELADIIISMTDFSLITVHPVASGGKTFQMSSLVQLAARQWLDSLGFLQRGKDDALDSLYSWLYCSEEEMSVWKKGEIVLPQLNLVLQYNYTSKDKLQKMVLLKKYAILYDNESGRYEGLEERAQEAFEFACQIEPEGDLNRIGAADVLAMVQKQMRHYEQAEKNYRYVADAREKVQSIGSVATLKAYDDLATVCRLLGRMEEAEKIEHRITEVREGELRKQSGGSSREELERVDFLLKLKKYAEAEQVQREVLKQMEKAPGKFHEDTLFLMRELVRVQLLQGKVDEAEKMSAEVLSGFKNLLGENSVSTRTAMQVRAIALSMKGNFVEADQVAKRLLDINKRILGTEHDDTKTIQSLVDRLKIDLDRN